jgi:CO/xanthine dehydrogenase Mo-binding subunit
MTGRFSPRPDAMSKLKGELVYLADRVPRDCLVGAILRSPHPHAAVLGIDTAAAAALPGVQAVVTAADLPAGLLVGIRKKDQPVLARDRVRYVGEPVAAVAATDEATARAALNAIRVDYEPLAVVGDAAFALSPEAPSIHPGGNLCHETFFARGELEETFLRSAHVVEAVYETPRQMHAALELEGGIAIPGSDGRLSPGHTRRDRRDSWQAG